MAGQATDPQIQYARTSDDVNIAYYTLGRGPPLIDMPTLPWSHIQLEWQVPERRDWFEWLAQRRTVVRFDNRGSGLSDRSDDFSLEAQVVDLEAVVRRLELDRFDLFAQFFAGAPAVAFAQRHPRRVDKLVLWHTFATSRNYLETPQSQALLALLDQDWEMFTETMASARLGWSEGAVARRFAAFLRETITQERLQASLATLAQYDVSDRLPFVQAPTLVVQRREYGGLTEETARQLASRLPNGRLTLLEGQAGAVFAGDVEPVRRVVAEFLAGGVGDAPAKPAVRRAVDGLLTRREDEVLRLLAGGQTNKEIAEVLSLSVHTVERHIANIYRKIGARGRADATAYALTRGSSQ